MIHNSDPLQPAQPVEEAELSAAFRQRMQQAIVARVDLNKVDWDDDTPLSEAENDFLDSQMLLDEAIARWRRLPVSPRRIRPQVIAAGFCALVASLLFALLPTDRLTFGLDGQKLALLADPEQIGSPTDSQGDDLIRNRVRTAVAAPAAEFSRSGDMAMVDAPPASGPHGADAQILGSTHRELQSIHSVQPVRQAIDSAERLSYAFEPLHTGVTDMMRVLFENVSIDVLQWSPIPNVPTVGDTRIDSVV